MSGYEMSGYEMAPVFERTLALARWYLEDLDGATEADFRNLAASIKNLCDSARFLVFDRECRRHEVEQKRENLVAMHAYKSEQTK